MEAKELFLRAARGHVDGLAARVAALEASPDPERRAWSLALRGAHAASAPEGARALEFDEVRAVTAADPTPLRLACMLGLRRAFLDMDGASLARWKALAATLLAAAPDEVPGLAVAHWLASIDHGDPDALAYDETRVAALRARAMADEDASAVIGLTIAQALAAETSGGPLDALALARRASRMSRTESIPQDEYLANVLLARYRRLTGHPHLAARILHALYRVAPAPWRGWFAWELLMSGSRAGLTGLDPAVPSPAGEASRLAAALLDRALEGDRRAFTASASSLRARCADVERLRYDAEALIAVLDGTVPIAETPASLHAWLRGDEVKPPRGLHGLAASATDADSLSRALVFVVADPGHAGRRVLAPGTPLLRAGYELVSQTSRRQGRLDSALAALALAGPEGLETEELFRRIYEFEYDPEIHHGALRKLLVRVHQWLGEAGAIESDPRGARLALRRPIVVADPRSVPPVDVRVLTVLAEEGAASARNAAQRLAIPLRTAQAALQALFDEGLCVREREGNHVAYRLEDTTFSEPTRV